MGLLWEKLWHREHQEAKRLTKQQKKKKQAEARKRPFESKESYKWIEAVKEVEKTLKAADEASKRPKIIHVFDREGDIAEVFEEVRNTPNTGVVVRAAHNRALSEENLGFLTNIAAQLLKMTYLNRTNPEAPASEVLNQVQIEVLVAKSRKPVTKEA
jgi:hypothetical protein